MRGIANDHRCVTPPDLDAVLALLREPGQSWQLLAGGTDVMVSFAAGVLPPGSWISIFHLDALRGIEVRDEVVVIGALTTYADVLAHPLLAREFAMLGAAARLSGAAAIQNRGTLGGNIVNASPAADTPPALFAYGATIELASFGARRMVPYEDFHTGYKTTTRRPDELVAAIHLPRRATPWREHYRKVGTRKAQAIAKVGLAVAMEIEDAVVVDARVGLSSVAAVPLAAVRTAAALRGLDLAAGPAARAEVLRTLCDEVRPIDDVRSTAAYRRRVAANLLDDVLSAIADTCATAHRS